MPFPPSAKSAQSAAAFLLVALALYANALLNPFLIDDLDAIVSHPDVVEPGGILRLWGHDYWAGRSPEDRNLYRPVVVASYWLNARVTGLSPTGFRVVNIALLAGLGWLVCRWVVALAGDAKPQAAWGAWAAGLLVVCHPVHATVVNNIIGRADLLAMAGVVAFAVLQAQRRWTPFTISAAGLACVVALGSKETGLLLLPIALAQYRTRTDVLIPGIAIAAYLLARIVIVGIVPHYATAAMDLTGNPLRGMGLWDRLPTAMSLVWLYLRETLWPTMRASFIPDALPGWSAAAAWAGAGVLLALIGATTHAWKRRPALVVAGVLAVGNLLLIGNLLTPIGVYAGYRLMPPFIVATAILAVQRRHTLWIVLAACVLGGGVVIATNPDWRSHASLMSANVARQPDNMRAHFLLGVALGELGRQREGVEYVARAVQRHPESSQARHEYGKMLIVLGRFDEAIANYQDLLRHHPEDVQAMNQLAGLYMVREEFNLAHAWLSKATRIAPTDAGILHNAAVLAAMTGQINEALLRYEALLREHPDHAAGRAEYDELRRQLQR